MSLFRELMALRISRDYYANGLLDEVLKLSRNFRELPIQSKVVARRLSEKCLVWHTIEVAPWIIRPQVEFIST